jgi:hypothetical protein
MRQILTMGIFLLVRYIGTFVGVMSFLIALVGVYLIVVPHEYLHGVLVTLVGLVSTALAGTVMGWAAKRFLDVR